MPLDSIIAFIACTAVANRLKQYKKSCSRHGAEIVLQVMCVAFLCSTVCYDVAHALVAYWGGDIKELGARLRKNRTGSSIVRGLN